MELGSVGADRGGLPQLDLWYKSVQSDEQLKNELRAQLEACSGFSIVSEDQVKAWRSNVIIPLETASPEHEGMSAIHWLLTEINSSNNNSNKVGSAHEDDAHLFGLLLATGVSPDAEIDDTTRRQTAAHLCAKFALPQCLEMLKECRADLGAFEMKTGYTPAKIAEIRLQECSSATAEGCDDDVLNKEEHTLLMKNLQAISESLQKARATTDERAINGRTAEGIYLDEANSKSSLAALARKGHRHCVQNLIRRRLFALQQSEFTCRDDEDGKTAEEWAHHHGWDDVAVELRFWRERAESLGSSIMVDQELRKVPFQDMSQLLPTIQLPTEYPLWSSGESKHRDETLRMLKPFSTHAITSLQQFYDLYTRVIQPYHRSVMGTGDGETALYAAVRDSNDDVLLSALLAVGLHPDQPDGSSPYSRLSLMVSLHHRPRSKKLLLDCGVHIEGVEPDETTTPADDEQQGDLSGRKSESTSAPQQCERKDTSRLARLARRGCFTAIQNLMRRPSWVEPEEFIISAQSRENGLSAQQWAIEHGRVDVAAEMEFWKNNIEEARKFCLQQFIHFCKDSGAQIMEPDEEVLENLNPREWMELCLFAPVVNASQDQHHAIPLLVKLAQDVDFGIYSNSSYMELKQMLGLAPEYFGIVEEVFAEFVEKSRPDTVSALSLFYLFRSDENAICRLLRRVGQKLDHIARNSRGETTLFIVMKRYFSLDAMRVVLEAAKNHGPGSETLQELVKAQEPQTQYTAADYCLSSLNWTRYLDVMLKMTEQQHIVAQLPKFPGPPYIEAVQRLRRERKIVGLFCDPPEHTDVMGHSSQPFLIPGIPTLFTPSDLANISKAVDSQNTKKRMWCTSDQILKYALRELPGFLLRKNDPCFLAIPSTFPECPYVHKDRQKGWAAEKKVFERLQETLKKHVEQSDPKKNLKIVLFHSLNYLHCRSSNNKSNCNNTEVAQPSTPGTSAAPSQKKPSVMESEIDMVALCWESVDPAVGSTESYFAMFFEVKGGVKIEDCIRWKAVLQSAQHLEALRTQLEGNFLWVKPCIACPNATDSTKQRMMDMIRDKADVILKTWTLPNNVIRMIIDKIASSSSPFVALSYVELSDASDKRLLEDWIICHMETKSLSNLPAGSHEEFMKLLAWCLVKCLGVAVTSTSRSMDEVLDEDVVNGIYATAAAAAANTPNPSADSPVPPSTCDDAMKNVQHLPPAAPLALLTLRQRQLLQIPADNGYCQLIIGSWGTGKSFIAQQQLFLLCKQNPPLINEKRQAVYLCHSRNGAFNPQLQFLFKPYEFIEVVEWKSDTELTEYLTSIFQGTNANDERQVTYLVLDQLEDVQDPAVIQIIQQLFNSFSSSHSIKKTHQLQMFWVLLNPTDYFWYCTSDDSTRLYEEVTNSGMCTILDSTIRNTKAISTAVRRQLARIADPILKYGERFKPPQPAGHDGLDLFVAYYDLTPTHHATSATNHPTTSDGSSVIKGLAAATARATLSELKQKCGVSSDEVLIVLDSQYHSLASTNQLESQFWQALDESLVSVAGGSSNQLESMAPIMVRSPLLTDDGAIKPQQFSSDQRTEAFDFLVRARTLSKQWTKWDSLRDFLRNEDDDESTSKKLCKNMLLGIVHGLVHRQVTLRLQQQQSPSIGPKPKKQGNKQQKFLLDELMEELSSSQAKNTPGIKNKNKKYANTHTTLAHILEKFQYLCVLPQRVVNGYEAGVVVAVGFSEQNISNILSRAKAIAVVIASSASKNMIETLFDRIQDLSNCGSISKP